MATMPRKLYGTVVVGGVIINPLARVTAGGVHRILIGSSLKLNGSSKLTYRSENMKKLTYSFLLAVLINAVHFVEGNTYKA